MKILTTNIWIVVADETRGRIFSASDDQGGIIEIEALVHPESRVPEKNLANHAPGSYQTQKGKEQHGLNKQGKQKEHQADCFAKDIASRLEDARKKNKFKQLIIIAAPKFLGRLRSEISKPLAKQVAWELDKDLTKHTAEGVLAHLPEHIPQAID